MSFIGKVNEGTIHAAGFFLAYADEEVTRETRQFSEDSALVVVDENGGKHVPMGTAYPTNDGNAVGIAYEDVDVSCGDMAGSVVTGGAVVYEDRLAVTGATYDAVTVGDYVSPVAYGWYEEEGGEYTKSVDTTADPAKTYYAKVGDEYTAVTVGNYVSPVEQGWYESDGGTGYVESTDTVADGAKTYYAKTDVRMSDAAKSALEALGFKFIATTPAVVRPY